MLRSLLLLACALAGAGIAGGPADATPLIEVEIETTGRGALSGLDDPVPVVVSPDGRHVYAANHLSPGAVAVFERDTATGQLRFVEIHPGGDASGPALSTVITMAMSPDGLHLYVPAHYGATVSVFARDPSSGRLTFVQLLGPLEALAGAWSAIVSPDGAHVYVSAYYADMIAAFGRAAATGELTYLGAARDGEAGVVALAKPAGMALSPGGEHLYVAATDGDAVVAFTRDPSTGLPGFLGAWRNGDPGVGSFEEPWVVALDPDGTHLYATMSGSGPWGTASGIAVFGRDPGNGLLALQDVYTGGLAGHAVHDRTMLVTQNGVVLVNALGFGQPFSLLLLARDPVTGSLAHAGDLTGAPVVESPQNLALAPAGDTLYASLRSSGILALRPPTVSCPPAPLPGCRAAAPGGARLTLREDLLGAKDLLKWKWRGAGGGATLGDPVGGTTDYALCLYADDTPRAGTLARGGAACGRRACWKATGASGFSYRDRTGTPSGLGTVKLRVTSSGDAKLAVSGKGDRLPGIGLPFGAVTVRAQLVSGAGECWDSVFPAPHAETTPALFDQWSP